MTCHLLVETIEMPHAVEHLGQIVDLAVDAAARFALAINRVNHLVAARGVFEADADLDSWVGFSMTSYSSMYPSSFNTCAMPTQILLF